MSSGIRWGTGRGLPSLTLLVYCDLVWQLVMLVLCLVLRDEVEKLKQLNSASVGDDVISQSQREVAWLRQQLMFKEAEMNEMKRSAVTFTVVVVDLSIDSCTAPLVVTRMNCCQQQR